MDRTHAHLLATLRFECPSTGRSLDYDVPGDAGTLKDLWSRSLLRQCGHCGQVHRISFRAAYVSGMLTVARPQSH